jgi:hypothetical protein
MTLTRLRRPLIHASAGRGTRRAEWNDPEHPAEETPLPGAFFAPASTYSQTTVERLQATNRASIYTPGNVSVPVKVGDRIRDENGNLWEVTGNPMPYSNPFTGWNAGCEIPVEETRG